MFAHTLENVDHCLPATSMASKTKKPRFGDAEFQKVYEQAKQYVVENKVLRLYQKLDVRLGYRTIIICLNSTHKCNAHPCMHFVRRLPAQALARA